MNTQLFSRKALVDFLLCGSLKGLRGTHFRRRCSKALEEIFNMARTKEVEARR